MNGNSRLRTHFARRFRASTTLVRRLAAMVLKELIQLVRDRALLFFTIYIFTVNVFTAGSESHELSHARLVVYDGDHSQASRDLIYRFREPYFRFVGAVPSAERGLARLDRGDAVVLLDIPGRFEETLRRGARSAQVQVHVDTSKATQGYLASSYAAAIISGFASQWAAQHRVRSGSELSISNDDRVWFNPDMNDAWFNAIGELLTMMSVACVLLPASAMVREKERGTIEQLLVSPLSPIEILLPKLIAMTIVMVAGTALSVFAIMVPMFHVPVRGSMGLFFAITALYSATTAGLGLAAATFARNSGQIGVMVLLVVMPIVVLSGTWTPQESLPGALQALMLLSPLRHFIPIAYGILLRGEGLATLWGYAAAMAALGIGLFALAIWRFRRQFL